MLKGEGDSQPSLTLNAYYVHTVTCRVRCIHACMHLLALAAHHVSFSGAWRLARQTRTLHDLRDGGESCLFYIYCMINILLNLLQSEDSYWRASDTLHDLRDGGESCLFVIVWSTVNTLLCCGGRIPTTRKPEKTNEITDEIVPSVIYTDGNNSVSKSVGIYRRNIFVGIYRRCRRRSIQFVWKYEKTWWRQAILPRDSNWDSRTMTWHCHRRNHRRNKFVGDSVGKNHYMHPSANTLFLCFSFFFFPIPPLPSQTAAPLPNCSQTPIPTLHYSQHEHSSFLYLVRGHNIRFL